MTRAGLALCLLAGCAVWRGGALDAEKERAFLDTTGAELRDPHSLARRDPGRLDFARLRRARALAQDRAEAEAIAALGASLADARRFGPPVDPVALADELLARDYLDAEAHLVKARVLHDGGKHAQAAFHEAMARGVAASIFGSGDGRSEATALHVYDRREEDEVLVLLGLTRVAAVRDVKDGSAMIRCLDVAGQTRPLYFRRYSKITGTDVVTPAP